jgi:hypothetical protein
MPEEGKGNRRRLAIQPLEKKVKAALATFELNDRSFNDIYKELNDELVAYSALNKKL